MISDDPRPSATPSLRRMLLGVSAAGLLAFSIGCTTPPELPPISASGVYHPGKVVWRDLLTPDMEASRAFYSGMFGWAFESVGPGYDLIRHNGRLIAGMADLDTPGAVSHWIPQVSVQDVDATAAAAVAAGGRQHLAPFDVPGRGRVALLADPWGAAFGVVRTAQGDPPDREPGADEWLWTEIWSRDVPGAAAFYTMLLGYSLVETTVMDAPYRYLARDGEPRVGLLEKADAGVGDMWVSYLRVEDVSAMARRAEALGGRIIVPPDPALRSGSVAIVADPNGAGIVLQAWTGQVGRE